MNIFIRTLYFYYFFFFWLLSWNDFYEHLERLVLSEENFHFKEYMLELMEIHFIFVEILDWQISVDLSPHIWIAILVKWSKTQHCCLQRRLAVHLVLVYLSTADKVYILCRCLNPQPTLCNLPATCRTSLHNQATLLKGVKLWTFQSFHPFMFFFKYHFMLHVMHTLLWLSYKRLSLLGIILKWILQIFLTKILNIAVNACTVRTVLHDVTENIAGNKCNMLFT